MENQEIYYIEESQSWTCPMAGRWKVIAVGGGASGNFNVTGINYGIVIGNGGTTSFGSIISAEGGQTIDGGMKDSFFKADFVSGQYGYDGFTYGGGICYSQNKEISAVGNNSLMSLRGQGYGASGGAEALDIKYQTSSGTSTTTSHPFTTPHGAMKTTIVTLDKGETIPCTIGAGGVATLTAERLLEALGTKATGTSTTIETILSYVVNGNDGVIVLQYLGV